MGFLLLALSAICGIGSLVCFVLVIIQMFKNDQQTIAIISLVTLLCGIGGLIALVVGWMNAAKWGIQNIMIGWTACIVVSIILQVIGGSLVGG